jgi:hypothetical protein
VISEDQFAASLVSYVTAIASIREGELEQA